MKHLKNYLGILSMLVALMLLTIASCTPDAEKEDLICKVSVEISEGGIGVVSNNEVVSGGEVTLKAVPEATYRFVNWTVGGKEVSKENPYTTTITATTQFKANFEKDNYKITVTAGEGGTVKTTKEGELLNETEVEVLNGSKVTLTATPNEGYSFVNWTVNGEEVSKEATYTITVTKDVEYVANFITHKVTVIAGEGGTATASKNQVGHNGQVTLTATPQEGYSFVNWTVNGEEVSKEATYTITVTKDVEYVANFITHKVTVIAGEGGTAKASKTQV
ncbi:MAG: InlB B-repeat-containing protein, partial [Muribaculaceae bacterium]|nr:InlB B-repeat-containing protein [Muribaculaceae bacterium]